jgi:hypothetical protein
MPPIYAKARGSRKWTRAHRKAGKGGTTVKAKSKKGKKAMKARKRRPAKTAEKSVGKPLAGNAFAPRAGG